VSARKDILAGALHVKPICIVFHDELYLVYQRNGILRSSRARMHEGEIAADMGVDVVTRQNGLSSEE
jgi:hypothetical protein